MMIGNQMQQVLSGATNSTLSHAQTQSNFNNFNLTSGSSNFNNMNMAGGSTSSINTHQQ
jgi:hypothetical protein